MAKSGKTGNHPESGKNRRQQTDVQVDFPGKKSVRATGGWEQYRQVEAPESLGKQADRSAAVGRTHRQAAKDGGRKNAQAAHRWMGVAFCRTPAGIVCRLDFFPRAGASCGNPGGAGGGRLVQRNDKGEAIRAARETEKNEKPFALLRETPDLPPMVSPSAINLLVMARDVEANLYDTLLIVSMNPEDGAVRLVNIPRDLFVDYSEEAVSRISKKISGINDKPALRKINAAAQAWKADWLPRGQSAVRVTRLRFYRGSH